MATLEKGDPAPLFSLPLDNGEIISLEQLRGNPVVLYFYPKDDTSGCTIEAIDFTTLLPKFTAANVRVFGISPDSIAKHCKFKSKHDLDVQLLSDEEKTVSEAYGVWVEKSMYGRKYMGVERTTFLIDKDGNIAEIWRKVKIPGHAESVLKTAEEL